MKTAWYFVTVIIIVPVLAFACISWYRQQFSLPPVLGPEGHTVKSISATDQYDSHDSVSFKNKVSVVNLFFTRCPVVCPRMMNNLKTVQQESGYEINILSFSIDPENDSAGRLKQYAQRMGIRNNWHLYTGAKKDIYKFARKDLMLLATDGDGGENDFIHSDNIVLIDKEGKIRGYYKGVDDGQVEELIKDINKLSNN